MLALMIVALARSGGELLTNSLPDVTTQGGRTEMAIRKLLALEQLPIRERTTLHLAEWTHDLLLNEQDPGDEQISQPTARPPIVNALRVKPAKAAPQFRIKRTGQPLTIIAASG